MKERGQASGRQTVMGTISRVMGVLLLLAGSAGCAGRDAGGRAEVPEATPSATPSSRPGGLVPDGYTGRFRVAASVLANEKHGPQLCTKMLDISPPQCGGFEVAGWTWDGLPHESEGETKWGSYLLTGTLAGRALTLTEPAKVSDGSFTRPPRQPAGTPCAEPLGGWKPLDPAKATDAALQAAIVAANAAPDFAGLWLDRREPPDAPGNGVNDPTKLVLNIQFTKDVAKHEAEIRTVWGGSLCVTQKGRSMAELTRIQNEIDDIVSSTVDPVAGVVEVEVFVATQARQREFDARYGPGVVRLSGVLTPID